MHLVIWDASKWEIVLDKLSQYHPMISTMYDIAIVNTKLGLQLIWPVYTQINFWNLDTGKESVTLKMVKDGFLYIFSFVVMALMVLFNVFDYYEESFLSTTKPCNQIKLSQKSKSFPRPMAHRAAPISFSIAMGYASANAMKATAGGWSTGSSACLTSPLLSHFSSARREGQRVPFLKSLV